MSVYRYNRPDNSENNGNIKPNIVRDGSILFSTKSGETFYEDVVKFLNLYDRIYHDKPISYFIEMLTFSLLTLGVNKKFSIFVLWR